MKVGAVRCSDTFQTQTASSFLSVVLFYSKPFLSHVAIYHISISGAGQDLQCPVTEDNSLTLDKMPLGDCFCPLLLSHLGASGTAMQPSWTVFFSAQNIMHTLGKTLPAPRCPLSSINTSRSKICASWVAIYPGFHKGFPHLLEGDWLLRLISSAA